MSRNQVARSASVMCLAGGTLQVNYGLLAIPLGPYSQANYGWDEVLWACATIGMIGGIVGLLAIDVARPRWLAWIAAALAILACLLRIATSALLIFRPAPDWDALILVSIALMLVGMTSLGITCVVSNQLHGWRAWIPLSVPVFGFITAALYSVNEYVHFIVLGVWGVPWLLVGHVVLTRATEIYRRGDREGRVRPEGGLGGAARTP